MKEFVMKPEGSSIKALSITKSKAKLYEFKIPEEDHIKIDIPLIRLIDLTIGILGDISSDFETIDLENEKSNLLFAANYFDAILKSKAVDESKDFFRILASSSYYLSGNFGNARVILRDYEYSNLEARQLENIIISIIKKEIRRNIDFNNNPYSNLIKNIVKNLEAFINNGTNNDELILATLELKKFIRKHGNDRELLFSDIIYSLCLNYFKHSVWKTVPEFSGIDISIWERYLKREKFIKELWPAQIIIGKEGIFRGKSGVIQMPTSSGKTKSTELIIRSLFLRNSSANAVIVAPLRALCQEIYEIIKENFIEDEDVNVSLSSDVLQYDFDYLKNKPYKITILTPEKLDYILRQNADISNGIDLIIYDEGHLFNDFSRGVKYELLLSSLKQKLSNKTQVVLISAVLPNANDIGKWLIGDNSIIIETKNILPLNRNLAFVSWTRPKGWLYFVKQENIDREEFFVPYVLEQSKLSLHGRERIERYFPKKEPYQISLSLGFRLVENGSIAIFVGKKQSAIKVAENAVDAFERGLEFKTPFQFSNTLELERLNKYIEYLLGPESVQFKASKLGIYVHHGNTPYGLKLSIEYAMLNQHAKFIICTSTLAQGVNLPIRYLIIATSKQGRDEIKVSDFHNLIGRVGRAGIYTEGNIIFANYEIYDRRHNRFKNYPWLKTKELLNIENAEICKSHILTIFNDKPTDEKEIIKWEENNFNIRAEIENFLISALENLDNQLNLECSVTKIAKNTLAYYQANDEEKKQLISIFLSIAKDIIDKEASPEKRKVFSRAIVNITEAKEILTFLNENLDNLVNKNALEIFEIIWPVIFKYSKKLPRIIPEAILLNLCKQWILGQSFKNLFSIIINERISIKRKATLDSTVDICENRFGFEGSFIIGSCAEIIELLDINETDTISELRLLQKMVKYGLPSKSSIIIYELGLIDRKLSIDIAEIIKNPLKSISRKKIIRAIIDNKDKVSLYIKENMPAYFDKRFSELIHDYS